MKLSVVIPTYNEELAVKENVRQLVRALLALAYDWELILVNDGSTDATLSIIQESAKAESRIKIVSYTPNRGRGYALKKGFAVAKGEYVVATESDLNWGTEIIGRFVKELEGGGIDIVIASPHMKGGKMENVPFLRWLLSYLGNVVFSMALPGHLTMATGMTRGYRREVLESMDLQSDDKELHVEILSKALDLGYKVKEIPAILRWKKPVPGEKVRKSHFKFRSIAKHLLLSLDIRPYLLFGFFGPLLIIVGLVMGVYLAYLWFSGVSIGARPMLFASILAIIIGFQMLVFGFLAGQSRDLKRQFVRMRAYVSRFGNKLRE